MPQEFYKSSNYAPSASEHTVVYVAPANVTYVEVVSLLVSNTTSSHETVIARWSNYKDKIPSSPSAVFGGDGVTPVRKIFTFQPKSIISGGLVPSATTLSLLDENKLFLGPKDFVQIKPFSSSALDITLAYKEVFEDGITPDRYDPSSVQQAVGTGNTPSGDY